jgi:hypothetical protein
LAILAGHRGRRDRTNADTAKGDLADLIAMMGPGGMLSATGSQTR